MNMGTSSWRLMTVTPTTITIIILVIISITSYLYQVGALDKGGSLKLEPADLAVGSTFDASSSYRKYILPDQDSS